MTQKLSLKIHQVAQEIHFAKALASNDKILRERALKRLRRWITTLSKRQVDLDEDGCMRLWKGILSNIWMSDKPLIQEQTVDTVCSLLFLFSDPNTVLTFIKCYFRSISQLWMSLDLHRLDKFMMLVRRFLRGILTLSKQRDWDDSFVRDFGQAFSSHLSSAPLGLVLHVADIFLEELAKVGGEEINEATVKLLLIPWLNVFCTSVDNRLLSSIKENVFLYLLRQSDLGIEHSAKFDVWKNLGFPGGNIKVIDQLVEEADDESFDEDGDDENETSLDPRAGHVDVVLPSIQFNPNLLVKEFKKRLQSPSTTTKARKSLKKLVEKFNEFIKGRYPLGIHEVPTIDDDIGPDEIEDAADDLLNFDMKEYKRSLSNKRPAIDLSPLQFRLAKKSRPQWEENDISMIPEDTTPQGPTIETKAALWDVTDSSVDGESSEPEGKQDICPQTHDFENELADSISGESEDVDSEEENTKSEESGDSDSGEEITINESKAKHQFVKNKKTSLRDNERRWSYPTPSESKRVCFVLSNNTAQEPHEYLKSVRSSPTVPFDVKKKPLHGVLKHTHLASPINPFYKFSNKKQKKR